MQGGGICTSCASVCLKFLLVLCSNLNLETVASTPPLVKQQPPAALLEVETAVCLHCPVSSLMLLLTLPICGRYGLYASYINDHPYWVMTG